LWGAIIYRILGYDRFDGKRIMGLLVGFAGVVALVGTNLHSTDLGAVVEVVIPTIGYAIGPLIISRKLGDLPGLGVIFASLVLASIFYAPYAVTHMPSHVSLEVALAVVGLAVVCTALAFVLFFELIVEVGPARSTVITYINPAVAILLGVVLLGEPFTVGIAIGFPLILLGSWMATSTPAVPAHSASAFFLGRPRLRIGPADGLRPASLSARRRTNSICALVLRSSSAAHRASASCTEGSSRKRMLLRSDRGTLDTRYWYSDPVLTIGCVPRSPHSTTRRFETIAAFRSSSSSTMPSSARRASAIWTIPTAPSTMRVRAAMTAPACWR